MLDATRFILSSFILFLAKYIVLSSVHYFILLYSDLYFFVFFLIYYILFYILCYFIFFSFVRQVLKVDQLARGCLELGFNIKISPGRLAKYTKVIDIP